MTRSAGRFEVALLSLALLSFVPVVGAGCGEQPALEIVFKTNLKLNTPRQVAKAVGAIELVVSSSSGIYPPGTEHRGGTVEVYNRNRDDLPDLVATIDMTQMNRLPVVRLERGGMDVDDPLDIEVEGFAPGEDRLLVATGAIPGVEFPAESIDSVTVQVDILNRYLPPRVTEAGPLSPTTVDNVKVVLSKGMELSSLNQDTIRVYRRDNGREELVSARRIESLVFPDINQPTTVTYWFEDLLEPGNYRINVTTGVRDASPEQRPLDQQPTEPGNQEFNWLFSVSS